jgi:vancomycin resistance protein YoaR
VTPDVTSDEARAFVDNVAAAATSEPVRIRVADVVRVLPPRVFAPALRVKVADGDLALAVDSETLRARSAAVFDSLPHHPSNARIAFRDGRPVVVRSTSGVSVTRSDWAAAVLRAVSSRGADRVARARVTPDPPSFSTADARRLRIDERLATVTLPVPPRAVDAVRTAAARLDGALVKPNGDFSFLRRVGVPDGGAEALTPTAVYSAAFDAGMGHIARTAPRSSVVGSDPGLDALVAGDADLAWVDETPYGVYVRATTSHGPGGETLTVSLWGHRYWSVTVSSSGRYNVVRPKTTRDSGRDCRPRRGVAGFDVDVSRRMAHASGAQRVERTHSHYEPVDAIVCR